MSSITNFDMASQVLALPLIQCKNSLFGKSYYYVTSDNKLKAKTYDYTPQDGECLKKIIGAPRAQLNDLVEKYGKLPQANIGNYHLEMCAAADGRFTALQLFRFVNYEYKPVTNVCIYEEAESLLIQKLF